MRKYPVLRKWSRLAHRGYRQAGHFIPHICKVWPSRAKKIDHLDGEVRGKESRYLILRAIEADPLGWNKGSSHDPPLHGDRGTQLCKRTLANPFPSPRFFLGCLAHEWSHVFLCISSTTIICRELITFILWSGGVSSLWLPAEYKQLSLVSFT